MAVQSKRFLLKKKRADRGDAPGRCDQGAESIRQHEVQPDRGGLDEPRSIPGKADQNVRGSVGLPNGIGKTVRVAVHAQGDNAEEGDGRGSGHRGRRRPGDEDQGGFMDFDVALATPDMMGVVGPLGRVLGPAG